MTLRTALVTLLVLSACGSSPESAPGQDTTAADTLPPQDAPDAVPTQDSVSPPLDVAVPNPDVTAPVDAIPADTLTDAGAVPDDTTAQDTDIEPDVPAPLPWEPAPEAIDLGTEESGHLRVQTAPLRVTLTRGGVTLTDTTAAAPFAVGTSDMTGPDAFHDPYEPYHLITWSDVTEATGEIENPDGSHLLRVVYGDPAREATLLLREEAPGRFLLALDIPAPTDEVLTRTNLDAHPDEHYYGLGETFDSVDHRGLRRPMHFEVTGLESANNEAHVPIPFFTSTRSWGAFVESRRLGVFDMAATADDRVTVDFSTTSLPVHLIAGAHPYEPLRHYVEMTGKPALPAPWAFGPHLWRNANEDQAEVLSDATAIRDNDLPGSVIWIDRPWESHYNDHVFDPGMFDDAPAMIEQLNAMGFRVIVWSSPYLEEALEGPYAEAVAGGYFPEVPGGQWIEKFGKLVDLTHPGAIALWKSLISNATSIGVEGFKLDYGEDVQAGVLGITLPFAFWNGETEATMHHHYAWFFHQPYAAMLKESEGFILSRAGTYGDQTLTTAVWPGDLCSGFQEFGHDGVHVGGLPSAIAGGLGLSASGYPFYGSDTGGFRHGRPTKHVMARWIEYSALGTIMQTGGGGKNHNPWDFQTYSGAGELGDEPTESKYDEELLDIYRTYARLHTRLFPYIYTYATLAHETGRPVTAPFGLAFPEEGHHPSYDFLLGDHLLVEPVIDATFERVITLPAGRWIDFFTGDVLEGPTQLTRPVALAELPLYVREGALIPLLRDDVDTLAPATSEGVVSTAKDPGVLEVRVYPSAAPTELALYDGAKLTQSTAPGAVSATTTPGTVYGPMRLIVQWGARPAATGAAPTEVLVDGQPAALEYDPDTETVRIDLDDAPHDVSVVE